MNWKSLFSASLFVASLTPFAAAQGGGMGGGIGGGMQQGSQGQLEGAVDAINRLMEIYLDGPEIKSILTPGEYVEWNLKLKAGQVLIAEARSEAFDPALELLDANKKPVAFNDDRFPGDQRPLLFWRCEKDGEYLLHARCFRDKSGGQVFVRFNTYDSIDGGNGAIVDREIDARAPFLIRVPMKPGQIVEVNVPAETPNKYLRYYFKTVIAPGGLPEESPSLSERISPTIRALIAPVAGDYYLMYSPMPTDKPRGHVEFQVREIVPGALTATSDGFVAKAQTNESNIWRLPVKAGQILEVRAPELRPNAALVIADQPDVSKCDLSKPESNPFIPRTGLPPLFPIGEDFDRLNGRAGDGRVTVFRAKRDTTLWLATDGVALQNKEFTVTIKPAARELIADRDCDANLRIAETNYWAFDAKAGDVMDFTSTAGAFTEAVSVLDPSLAAVTRFDAGTDQETIKWRTVVQSPGQYLFAMACSGNGGSGPYKLRRRVFHPKEIEVNEPATGDISEGQVQVWKFTATPDRPLFVHWHASKFSYGVAVYDDKGRPASIEQRQVDSENRYGILKVDETQTFIVVVNGGERATYSLELTDIPGYKPSRKS